MSTRHTPRRKQTDQPSLTCLHLGELCLLIEGGLRLNEARRRMKVTNRQIESALRKLDDVFAWTTRVKSILNSEIQAELYKKAMNGCVSAQGEYLRRLDRQRSEKAK